MNPVILSLLIALGTLLAYVAARYGSRRKWVPIDPKRPHEYVYPGDTGGYHACVICNRHQFDRVHYDGHGRTATPEEIAHSRFAQTYFVVEKPEGE